MSQTVYNSSLPQFIASKLWDKNHGDCKSASSSVPPLFWENVKPLSMLSWNHFSHLRRDVFAVSLPCLICWQRHPVLNPIKTSLGSEGDSSTWRFCFPSTYLKEIGYPAAAMYRGYIYVCVILYIYMPCFIFLYHFSKNAFPHECRRSPSCEYLVTKLSLAGCLYIFVWIHKMWTWFM